MKIAKMFGQIQITTWKKSIKWINLE